MSLEGVNLNGQAANLGPGSGLDLVGSRPLPQAGNRPEPPDPAGAESEDSFSLSPEAKNLLGEEEKKKVADSENKKEDEDLEEGELTEEEQDLVNRLKDRDREVRTHEQAHLRTAGSYARGGAQFEFQSGPDGKRYAVGGHVNIDVSKESDPESTITKAETIKRAALAPAEPSATDRQVAAKADQLRTEAQEEIREEALETRTESTEEPEAADGEETTTDTSHEPEEFDAFVAESDEAPAPTSEESQPRAGRFDGLTGVGNREDTAASGSLGAFANPYEDGGTRELIGQGISLIA